MRAAEAIASTGLGLPREMCDRVYDLPLRTIVREKNGEGKGGGLMRFGDACLALKKVSTDKVDPRGSREAP